MEYRKGGKGTVRYVMGKKGIRGMELREGERVRRNRKRRGVGRKRKDLNMMEMIQRGGCGRQGGKGDEGSERDGGMRRVAEEIVRGE